MSYEVRSIIIVFTAAIGSISCREVCQIRYAGAVNGLFPAKQITSTSALRLEATGNGTSFSASHVAGAASLLRDFGDDWQKIDDHRVAKAIRLNSADKGGGQKTLESNVLDKTGNTWMPPQPGADPLDENMGAGQLNVMSSMVQYTPDEALAGFQGSGIVDEGTLA